MKYLSVEQIAEQLGISTSCVWRWAADGKLPKPIKLSSRVTRWRADEIEQALSKLEEGAA